ncbi:hypothetical protein [Hydrogenimonas sp.]
MKSVLGRVLTLILLFFAAALHAGVDYDYELRLNKAKAYVGESVVLSMKVWQTDPASILFFEFAPQKSDAYSVRLLEERTEESVAGTTATFRYLLFPKRPGEVRVNFRFVVKRTTEARLRHNNTGEPVKAKAIDTTDTAEPLPARTLRVLVLPKEVALVGDYRLEAKLDHTSTRALSPVYLTLRLRGVGGEPPAGLDPLPKMEGVKVFADEPVVKVRYDEEGVHYDATFSYALLAEKDFLVPPVALEAFSCTRGELYTLKTRPMKVAVAPAELSTLVDKETRPESIYEIVESLKRWGLYLFIFACGFVSALLVERLRKRIHRKRGNDAFKKEVKHAKEAKALLKLLVRTDPHRYAPFIDDLENAVYKGEKVDVARMKKEVLRL